MSGEFKKSAIFALSGLILCGGLYTTVATLAGLGVFPEQARGSLIYQDNELRGSTLIAQPFTGDTYFHSRPSSVAHLPTDTGGSNLAPSNPELRAIARQLSQSVSAREGVALADIPVDMISMSGSGVDPHISEQAAALQIPRIARARGLAQENIAALVAQHTATPSFGVLGQSRVNVLTLNLALDNQ
ncbi:potassium-transporting ATPase subunit C [Aliidiomarina iranensis]|uniref:Potassium-transporting ATPase KdpC subunit n=2 Tax=Aliidiomarina iranensis TaxID=1434071 RepID=A0A432W378_9GAMM|nr:potassium-transporting ATPase subunit C [Aliidiomarina iranensis]